VIEHKFALQLKMHLNFVTAHFCDATRRVTLTQFLRGPSTCFRRPVQRARDSRSYGMPRKYLYTFVSHLFSMLLLPFVSV